MKWLNVYMCVCPFALYIRFSFLNIGFSLELPVLIFRQTYLERNTRSCLFSMYLHLRLVWYTHYVSLSLSFLYAHSLSLQYKWSQTFYTYECLLKKGLWKLTFPVRLFDLPTFSSNTCRLCIWIIFFPLSWLLSLSLSLSFSLCPHSNCTCFD